VAAVALLEALLEQRCVVTVKSRSRGLVELTQPCVVKAYPRDFPNPLLSWEGVNNTGFLWALVTPDRTGVHTWVRCSGTTPDGKVHVVNLDPTIQQFGADLCSVWFGEAREGGTLRFEETCVMGDARERLSRELCSDAMARDTYAALRAALALSQ
jgi:hypothetical protein